MAKWVNPKYTKAVAAVLQLPRRSWPDGRLRPHGAVMVADGGTYVVRPAGGKSVAE